MNPTVRDVAHRANVSISTVSRVLNDSGPASAERRKRVLEAVKFLNFTPHPAARSLIGRKTGTIGVILPHISGEFFSDLLSGLDAAIKKHDFLLMVSASRRLERDFILALDGLYKRIDGLIVMSPEFAADHVLSLTDPSIPVVFLNTKITTSGIHAVNFDNRGGMRKIAQHIASSGHRLVAYIGGPCDAFDAQEREQGFLESVPDELKIRTYTGNFTFECGYNRALDILCASPRPTAIVAANDLSALGAMRALLEYGIQIPDEIAITGFDGTKSSQYSTPSLTTVNIPIGDLAIHAVRLLVHQLSNEQRSECPCCGASMDIIVRESSLVKYPINSPVYHYDTEVAGP